MLIWILLILLLLFALGASFYFTYTAMKPDILPLEKQIERSLTNNGFDPAIAELPYEDWQLQGHVGQLQARFYPKGDCGKIVLLLHGYNAPWISMLKYYTLLDSLGYSILIPDHQAQGRSEGRWITYGAIESEDAILWLKELRQRYPAAEISVMGESMGGATALLTAEKCCERDIALAYCVADCPYNDCSDVLEFVGSKRYGFVVKLLMPLVAVWFRLLSGCSIKDASPITHIRKLTLPTLLVHGDADQVVPVTMSRRLAELSPYITYWEAKDAPHASVIACYNEEYRQRMKAFAASLEEVRL